MFLLAEMATLNVLDKNKPVKSIILSMEQRNKICWNEVAKCPSVRNLCLYSLLAVFRQQWLRILQTGQGQGKHSSIDLHTPNPNLNPRAKTTMHQPSNSTWIKKKHPKHLDWQWEEPVNQAYSVPTALLELIINFLNKKSRENKQPSNSCCTAAEGGNMWPSEIFLIRPAKVKRINSNSQ